MPVVIVAGKEDLVVNMESHSGRLDHELPQSELHVLADTGHMAHYSAQRLIVNVIDDTPVLQVPLPGASRVRTKAEAFSAAQG